MIQWPLLGGLLTGQVPICRGSSLCQQTLSVVSLCFFQLLILFLCENKY